MWDAAEVGDRKGNRTPDLHVFANEHAHVCHAEYFGEPDEHGQARRQPPSVLDALEPFGGPANETRERGSAHPLPVADDLDAFAGIPAFEVVQHGVPSQCSVTCRPGYAARARPGRGTTDAPHGHD